MYNLGEVDAMLESIPKEVHTGMFGICIYEDLHRSFSFEGAHITYKFADQPSENLQDKNGNIIEFDLQTFRCLSLTFFMDSSFLYSLEYVLKSNSSRISIAKIPIEQVDLESFEVLGLHYAKDSKQGYYAGKSKPLNDTICILDRHFSYEYQTFEPRDSTAQYMSAFAIGNKHVYYWGKEIKGADPETFIMYKREGWTTYLKDKYQVYVTNGPTIEVIDMDGETFICTDTVVTDAYKPIEKLDYPEQPLSSWQDDRAYIEFFTNNPHLKDYWFFSTQTELKVPPIEEATHLGSVYYEYNGKIYYESYELSESELLPEAKWEDYYHTQFRRWESEYSYRVEGDGQVYRRKWIPRLVEIDHLTKENFSLLEYSYATNGTDLFFYVNRYDGINMLSDVDIKQLHILGESWFSIGTEYYYRYDSYNRSSKKFKTDPASFTVINEIYAYDKEGLIVEGVRKKQVPWVGKYTLIGGAYIKIGDTYYNYGKALKNKSFDDSGPIQIINFWTVVDTHGACLQEGRYYKKYKEDPIP